MEAHRNLDDEFIAGSDWEDAPDHPYASDDDFDTVSVSSSLFSRAGTPDIEDLDPFDEDGFGEIDGGDDEVPQVQEQRPGSTRTQKHNRWRSRRRRALADAGSGRSASGRLRQAPTIEEAWDALMELRAKLRGRSKGKSGGYIDPKFDPFTRRRLEGMHGFLSLYTSSNTDNKGKWQKASYAAATTMGRGQYCARTLRAMARAFIEDRTVLPFNPYGDWNESLLVNEDLCQELNLHLQQLHTTDSGITASAVQTWLSREEIKLKYGITKTVSLSTASRYLKVMGYRFTQAPSGQYVDGHERPDVRWEREKVYIPQLDELRKRMRVYSSDGRDITDEIREEDGVLRVEGKRVVLWFHDESIFYAHDRRRRRWYHKDASIKPKKKGEGVSFMVADFVSADYGWLVGPMSGKNARRCLKPGKNRDGYFTNADILEQAQAAMDIFEEFGSDVEHVLIYDNATTHRKRADDALSARSMPKSKSSAGVFKTGKRKGQPRKNWLAERTCVDPETKRPIYLPDGSLKKEKIRMTGARFGDGRPQDLYGDDGLFKGMAEILKERGYDADRIDGLKPECPSFKCTAGATDCCCRRILFNEPDFAEIKSLLEIICEARGVRVLFLPKFHCELNPIEQCWGYAKRLYRMAPESSTEADLERNTLASMDAVPLLCIKRSVDTHHSLFGWFTDH